MSEITRRDIFVHAYISQGYDSDAAIEMADGLIALLAQSKAFLEPVLKPQVDWKPTLQKDVDYFHVQDKFANNYGFVPNGVTLSLVNDHLRVRSKGMRSSLNFNCYGWVDSCHTIDTIVFDLMTPNRGAWFYYNQNCIIGLNFEDGCLERIDYDHNVLTQSDERMICAKGDRIMIEVSRDHEKIDIYAENLTTKQNCFLALKDWNTVNNDEDILNMLFSDDVITEIELVYLSFGLQKTKCCGQYEFHSIKDFDWEEKEWFNSETFKDEYRTLARSGQFIAYVKRNLS